MKTTITIRKMKLVLLFLTIMLAVNAQEKTKTSRRLNGGFGHGSFTFQHTDIGALNGMLSDNGYGKINPDNFSWGGGGLFCINNFLIGGEGSGFLNSTVSNSSNSIDFNGGYGYCNLGYVLFSNDRSVLYPLIGIGGGGYSLTVKQKNLNGNFQDQLSSPSGGVIMDAGGLLFNAQVAYQYFLNKHGREGGFFVGIKTGYRYSPTAWKLSAGGQELSSAPGINMNGFFATLVIGGGSLMN